MGTARPGKRDCTARIGDQTGGARRTPNTGDVRAPCQRQSQGPPTRAVTNRTSDRAFASCPRSDREGSGGPGRRRSRDCLPSSGSKRPPRLRPKSGSSTCYSVANKLRVRSIWMRPSSISMRPTITTLSTNSSEIDSGRRIRKQLDTVQAFGQRSG